MSDLLLLPTLVVALSIAYALLNLIYNVFFHPLRKYPGPLLNKVTPALIGFHRINGSHCHYLKKLHEKYGRVVRVGPNELCFIDEQAWPDIHGHLSPSGVGNLPKDQRRARRDVNGSTNIIIANEADHRRFRRIQTNMFSEKTLLTQEPIIKGYIDMLISRLHEKARNPSSNVVDITNWFNYTTFDILGDLAFGEPFGCLKSDALHSWIEKTNLSVKDIGLYTASRCFPWPLNELIYRMSPRKVLTSRVEGSDFASQKARVRMSKISDRADYMSYILKHNDEKGMTRNEIENNARILIIAGSETTALLLSGLTYSLLRNPRHLAQLTDLIRSSFVSEEEITMHSLRDLEYLSALISESFRFYPPAPSNLMRLTTPGGSLICDNVVPEMTTVSISQFAANLSESNWTDADKFVPERWYKNEKCPERYRGDNRKVMNPFSYGPRNCIGQNLAMAEIRLMIARVLWNFDMELHNKGEDWFDQKVYLLWQKKPLYVKLTPRMA